MAFLGASLALGGFDLFLVEGVDTGGVSAGPGVAFGFAVGFAFGFEAADLGAGFATPNNALGIGQGLSLRMLPEAVIQSVGFNCPRENAQKRFIISSRTCAHLHSSD